MVWQIKQLSKVKAKNPILIEGLPGMGNVGKIAIDFLIDTLKAKPVYELFSYDLPHCVFVNEQNVLELPAIKIYYKNLKKNTLFFLSGDIQPISESSCYEFCNAVLDTVQKSDVNEIITLGGIALPKVPEDPKVYCTGNSRKMVERYNFDPVDTNIHGMVGPIVGVSGLLPGLAGVRKIPAVALLAETFGHPNYLGVRGARSLLKVLSKKLDLRLNLNELDAQIREIEQDAKKSLELQKVSALLKKQKSESKFPSPTRDGTNYIG